MRHIQAYKCDDARTGSDCLDRTVAAISDGPQTGITHVCMITCHSRLGLRTNRASRWRKVGETAECVSFRRHPWTSEGQFKEWNLTLSKQNLAGTPETAPPQANINPNPVFFFFFFNNSTTLCHAKLQLFVCICLKMCRYSRNFVIKTLIKCSFGDFAVVASLK